MTEGNSRVTGIAGLISILEQAVIAKGIKWPLYEHQRFFCNATKIIAIWHRIYKHFKIQQVALDYIPGIILKAIYK